MAGLYDPKGVFQLQLFYDFPTKYAFSYLRKYKDALRRELSFLKVW